MMSDFGRKTLNRYFSIAKVFLVLTPVLCLVYLTALGEMRGNNLAQLLEADPAVSVLFLASMLNPFAAHLLHYAQKRATGGDFAYAIVNLIGLAAVEAILMNVVYTALFLFLLYQVRKFGRTGVLTALRQRSFKQSLYALSGSLIMLPFACLCLFAQVRLIAGA